MPIIIIIICEKGVESSQKPVKYVLLRSGEEQIGALVNHRPIQMQFCNRIAANRIESIRMIFDRFLCIFAKHQQQTNNNKSNNNNKNINNNKWYEKKCREKRKERMLSSMYID